MKTIKLTDKQFETLERLLDYEFDQELNYQESGDRDTSLLEDYLELYEALYKKNADNFIQAFVYDDIIETKKKHIAYLKESS